MSTSELRGAEIGRLVRVIAAAYEDEPGEAMPWALLEGLLHLVPCDLDVSYQHHDHVAGRTVCLQSTDRPAAPVDPGGIPDPSDDPFWQHWWRLDCSWPQRTGNLRAVVHTGDFYPSERARRAGLTAEVLPELRASMMVSLPAPPGEARRVLFMRNSGPGFTERDRQLVQLLRPHLQEIWLDAERRRAGVPQLTAREWEVLAMAAAGLSYAEIGRRLFIAQGTVRKHTENVRTRLGVHSIRAAAAVALPHAPSQLRPPDRVVAGRSAGRVVGVGRVGLEPTTQGL